MKEDEQKLLYILGCMVKGNPEGEEARLVEYIEWARSDFLPSVLEDDDHYLYSAAIQVKQFLDRLVGETDE